MSEVKKSAAPKKAKKTKWEKPRHKLTYGFMHIFFRIFVWWKMGYTAKLHKLDKKQGYIVVSNHQSFYDGYLVNMGFNRPLFVMAGDYMFNTGKPAERMNYLFAPIPKVKAGSDPASMINTMRILKEGSCVLIFPEASRTYDGKFGEVPESMGRFIKKMKVPVIIYNLVGCYSADPRWGGAPRRGKCEGVVKRMISVEELAGMSEEEVTQALKDGLYMDESTTVHRYRSEKGAEYLDRLLYVCPKCGKFSCLHSEGNYVTCTECGLKAEYTENTTFKFENFQTDITNVADWVAWQDPQLAKFDGQEGVIFSDENVNIETCDRNVLRQNLGTGRIEIDKDEMRVICENETYRFGHDEFTIISPIGWTKILFTTRRGSFMINGPERFNPYKYVKLIYHITGNPDQVR